MYNPVAASMLIGDDDVPVNHSGCVPEMVAPAATAQLELAYPHAGI